MVAAEHSWHALSQSWPSAFALWFTKVPHDARQRALARRRCFIDEPGNVARQLVAVPALQEEDGIDGTGDKAVARQWKDDIAQWKSTAQLSRVWDHASF